MLNIMIGCLHGFCKAKSAETYAFVFLYLYYASLVRCGGAFHELQEWKNMAAVHVNLIS
jgi:hypothetical protein